MKLPRLDVDSDEVVASTESKTTLGAEKSILRVSVVVVLEIRSGLVRKLTVGKVVEALDRRPDPLARVLMSLDVCLNATRSRIMVGTIDFAKPMRRVINE